MKLKLDECVDIRFVKYFEEAGFDVTTVYSQNASGANDSKLYEMCKSEGRALITLDSHFTDMLKYPPADTKGIAVLRGHDDLFPTVKTLVNALIGGLKSNSPAGKLWIVESHRIRVRGS